MRGAEPERLVFLRSEPTILVEAVARLQAAGRGWDNVAPDVDEADLPPPSTTFGRWFSARGPEVPQGTWVAGARRGDRQQAPSQLGVEHASGPKAVVTLRELGLELPEGWIVRQDHPRRGLVVQIPPDSDPATIVDVLLGATARLTRITISDRWLADVYVG